MIRKTIQAIGVILGFATMLAIMYVLIIEKPKEHPMLCPYCHTIVLFEP